MVNTPLRYPGGKSVMTDFFKAFIVENEMQSVIYAEPYAGGVGAGINLLLSDRISKLYINDANIAVYAFWYSLLYHSDEFINMFEKVDITLEEWEKQRLIFKSEVIDSDDKPYLQLGFATFFMNRCNRSGIISAWPIGGSTEEKQLKANYKIDARFKKELLRDRLLNIINRKDSIKVFNKDAMQFLKEDVETLSVAKQTNTIVYLDPPYFEQGSNLYMNYYKKEDHQNLANYLEIKKEFKWILSYDNVEYIRNLYGYTRQYTFDLRYFVQNRKLGSELLFFSNNSTIPNIKLIKKFSERRKLIDLKEVETPNISEKNESLMYG